MADITATPPSEAFNKYIDVVCSCIQVNMETSNALATGSENSNDGLVSLTQAWTTDTGNTPNGSQVVNGQTYPVYNNPVTAALYGGCYLDGTTYVTPPAPFNISDGIEKVTNNPPLIDAFINTYFASGSGKSYINDLSSSTVLDVIGLLKNNWDPSGHGQQSSLALSTANSMNTLVSAEGTNNEQTLQNICSTLTNMLGQSQNALQTIVSGGSTVTQTVSSLVNSMSYY